VPDRFPSTGIVATLLSATFLAISCSPAPEPPMTDSEDLPAGAASAADTLRGTVLYRERMMPPPGAVLTVTLEDVSRADAPAEVLARQEIPLEGGPPYAFALSYEPDAIQDRHRYSVRARIQEGDRLLWTSTESTPPFDRPAGSPIEILLTRIGDRGAGR